MGTFNQFHHFLGLVCVDTMAEHIVVHNDVSGQVSDSADKDKDDLSINISLKKNITQSR